MDLVTLSPSTGHAVRVLASGLPDYPLLQPSLSPDGRTAWFARIGGGGTAAGGGTHLASVGVDGGPVIDRTPPGSPDEAPAVSPYGTLLAFYRARYDAPQADDRVWLVIESLTAGRVVAERLSAGVEPYWSPDGRHLLEEPGRGGDPCPVVDDLGPDGIIIATHRPDPGLCSLPSAMNYLPDGSILSGVACPADPLHMPGGALARVDPVTFHSSILLCLPTGVLATSVCVEDGGQILLVAGPPAQRGGSLYEVSGGHVRAINDRRNLIRVACR